jgi:hypothetical protein
VGPILCPKGHWPICNVVYDKSFTKFEIDFAEQCDPTEIETIQEQMQQDNAQVWHNEHVAQNVDATDERQKIIETALADIHHQGVVEAGEKTKNQEKPKRLQWIS